MWVGFGISVVCQISNLYCHVILRNLRPADGKGGYQIPDGFLFNYVTCANYTTEIWQWIGFIIATGGGLASYLFMIVAMYFMTGWALQKHKRLEKVMYLIYMSSWAFFLSFFLFLFRFFWYLLDLTMLDSDCDKDLPNVCVKNRSHRVYNHSLLIHIEIETFARKNHSWFLHVADILVHFESLDTDCIMSYSYSIWLTMAYLLFCADV